MIMQKIQNNKWLILAILILMSNAVIYQMAFIQSMPPSETIGVVTGSLIDCAIIAPALLLLHRKQWSWKKAFLYAMSGIVFARVIIPGPFIAPFAVITWTGILVEVALVVFEMAMIIVFVRYLPVIIRTVKASSVPLLFEFPQVVQQKAAKNFIIQIICMELLMFYYAFFTWRKKAPSNGFTVYKKTMYMPMLIMVFHACIFEAFAFHWLFVDRWPLVAWIHLAVTVYGLVFFLADFQATRLHPVTIQNGTLYLSNGMMKRTRIDVQQIQAIHSELDSDAIHSFAILGSTEEKPQFILEMKQPQTIHIVMGFEKQAQFIGIVVDEPRALREAIEQARLH